MKNLWGVQDKNHLMFLTTLVKLGCLCISVVGFAAEPVKTPAARKPSNATALSKPSSSQSSAQTVLKVDVNRISELAGTWSTGCVAETRTQLTMEFNQEKMTGKIVRYLDTECTKPTATLVQVYKVTPGERIKETPSDARAVDTTLVSFSLIPATQDEATSYSKLYGIKMTPGVMTEVTGINGLPKKGLVTYTIYRLKEGVLEIGERDSYFKMGRPSAFSKMPLKKVK